MLESHAGWVKLDTEGWGDHEWDDALGKLTLDLDPDNDVLIIW